MSITYHHFWKKVAIFAGPNISSGYYVHSSESYDKYRSMPFSSFGGHFAFYTKSDQSVYHLPDYVCDDLGLINDVDGGWPISFLGYNTGQKIYSSRPAIDIIDWVEERFDRQKLDTYSEAEKKLIKLADSLDEEDNPVIVEYVLR